MELAKRYMQLFACDCLHEIVYMRLFHAFVYMRLFHAFVYMRLFTCDRLRQFKSNAHACMRVCVFIVHLLYD